MPSIISHVKNIVWLKLYHLFLIIFLVDVRIKKNSYQRRMIAKQNAYHLKIQIPKSQKMKNAFKLSPGTQIFANNIAAFIKLLLLKTKKMEKKMEKKMKNLKRDLLVCIKTKNMNNMNLKVNSVKEIVYI